MYTPTVYLAEIGLRHEVLKKLNGDFIFTLDGLKQAEADGRLGQLLTDEERDHVARKIAAWTTK